MATTLAANASDHAMPELKRIGDAAGWQHAVALAIWRGDRDVVAYLSRSQSAPPCGHSDLPTFETCGFGGPIQAEPSRIVDRKAAAARRVGEWHGAGSRCRRPVAARVTILPPACTP